MITLYYAKKEILHQKSQNNEKNLNKLAIQGILYDINSQKIYKNKKK